MEKPINFSLKGDDGREYSLDDFKGKWLVLYFYPKDDTPGCTLEALEFSALKDEFEKLNAVVVGVSRDDISSHKKFKDKRGLNILLLSDENAEVIKAYGFWGKKFGREGTIRSTVLISPEGKVVKVWKGVKAKGHAKEVLEYLKALVES